MKRHTSPRSLRATSCLALAGALFLPAAARAGDMTNPEFKYGKAEEVVSDKPAEVEWKAKAKLGLIVSTGNAQSGSGSLAASVSRKANMNKFAFDAGWAYARARVLTAIDEDKSGAIDPWELSRQEDTTQNAWNLKGRYDRFLSLNNALYAAALVGGDEPAGKELAGGGQLGYSRQLYASKHHTLVGEAGYDFSYESYVGDTESVSIHSMRLFAGYDLKITDDAGLFANLEYLANLNTEKVPTESGSGEAKAFKDSRLNFKAGVSSTLFEKLSISLGFTLKYDHTPAPRPAFKIPYAAGFVPLANKLDTITEAALIYTFL